jgi:hypothetical protein
MKKYIAILFLIIVLASACIQTKTKNNRSTKNNTEAIDGEPILTYNTSTDQFIIIGGYSTNYTLSRDIMATDFSIVIGENRSANLSGIELLQSTTHLQINLLDTWDIDFSPLRSLPNLQYLYLWGLSSIPDLGDIPSLIGLELDFSILTSLNGIENIQSLESLIISENYVPLTNISAIRYLRNLKSFHLYGEFYNNIDFSVLGDLPELKWLWLSGGGEVDLIGIGQAKSIEKLHLESNISKRIDERGIYKNIEEIGRMTWLKELYLDESITSVEFLANNVNLERLELIADEERDDYTTVKLPLDVTPLRNLVNLKYLAIRGFELGNAEVLKELPNLFSFYTNLFSSLD